MQTPLSPTITPPALLILLLLSVTAVGQFVVPGSSSSGNPQTDLDKATSRWDSLNVTDYDYRYSERCFVTCNDSISRRKNVQVRNSTIVSVEYAYHSDGLDPVVPPEAVDTVKTVPELFVRVQDAIDAGAASITAQYDADYGHPVYILIDYDKSTKGEEFSARIESLIDIRVTASRQTELDAALALWQSYRAVDYNYFYRRSCFCMFELTKRMYVEVRNNTVAAGYFAEDNNPASDDMVKNWLKTIDDNFVMIQSAIDRPAHSMKVTYNETYGYPMVISIDYEKMMADEEMYVRADRLEILAVAEEPEPAVAAVEDVEADPKLTANTTEDQNVTVTCDGPNGVQYSPGDSFMDAEGCNTCRCTDSGGIACTEMSCVEENPEDKSISTSAAVLDISRGERHGERAVASIVRISLPAVVYLIALLR